MCEHVFRCVEFCWPHFTLSLSLSLCFCSLSLWIVLRTGNWQWLLPGSSWIDSLNIFTKWRHIDLTAACPVSVRMMSFTASNLFDLFGSCFTAAHHGNATLSAQSNQSCSFKRHSLCQVSDQTPEVGIENRHDLMQCDCLLSTFPWFARLSSTLSLHVH